MTTGATQGGLGRAGPGRATQTPRGAERGGSGRTGWRCDPKSATSILPSVVTVGSWQSQYR